MHIRYISIFPDIYTSFLSQSLIAKAREKTILTIHTVNPRDFCHDTHKQIDDTPYGGGPGMLLKAQPLADAVAYCVSQCTAQRYLICCLSPSVQIFDQMHAVQYANDYDAIIFVSGRYEGIDHRFFIHMKNIYADAFVSVSIGSYILLGGEVASMVVTEAIVRLLPGIIGDTGSTVEESYTPVDNMQSLEYPQYTRPHERESMTVPDVLLSGHHAHIQQRRMSQRTVII